MRERDFDLHSIRPHIEGRTVKSIVFDGREGWFSDNEVRNCTITLEDGSEIHFSSTWDIGDSALCVDFNKPTSKA